MHNTSKYSILSPGDEIINREPVFIREGHRYRCLGNRKTLYVVIGNSSLPGFVKLQVKKSQGVHPDPVGLVLDKPLMNLLNAVKVESEPIYRNGGHLEGYDESGKRVVMDSACQGGYAVGASHEENGIKGTVGTAKSPIEFEGKEIILTAPVSGSKSKYEFEGEELTPRQIASRLNVDHGGVSFEEGGDLSNINCRCSGRLYRFGGESISDFDILNRITEDYKKKLEKGFELERAEHGDDVNAYNAGNITRDELFYRIADTHLRENPNYYDHYKS